MWTVFTAVRRWRRPEGAVHGAAERPLCGMGPSAGIRADLVYGAAEHVWGHALLRRRESLLEALSGEYHLQSLLRRRGLLRAGDVLLEPVRVLRAGMYCQPGQSSALCRHWSTVRQRGYNRSFSAFFSDYHNLYIFACYTLNGQGHWEYVFVRGNGPGGSGRKAARIWRSGKCLWWTMRAGCASW